jgi:hypothetical protein
MHALGSMNPQKFSPGVRGTDQSRPQMLLPGVSDASLVLLCITPRG